MRFKSCLKVGVVGLLGHPMTKGLATIRSLLPFASCAGGWLLTLWPSDVHLDCVPAHLSVVHALDASLRLLIGAECDESKASARVEEVSHLTKLLHLLLESLVDHLLPYVVDEDLPALLGH